MTDAIQEHQSSKRFSLKTLIITFIVAAVVSSLVTIASTLALVHSGAIALATNANERTLASNAQDSCSTTIRVVATVNQWGTLAKELGGSCVEVTSIINSTSVEPHDYEPTAADLAKLARADVAISNGAGYDDWSAKAQKHDSQQQVVTVAKLVGIEHSSHSKHEHEHNHDQHNHEHEHEQHSNHEDETHEDEESVNPHLWFKPQAILQAAQAISKAYITIAGSDSNTAATVRKHSNAWNVSFAQFADMVNRDRQTPTERHFVASESVINYLMEYLGASDKTPSGYAHAINNESEPSASDLKETLDTLASSDVDMLILNTQEESEFSNKLVAQAKASKKSIINVTEQIPADQQSLLGWISGIAKQILAVKR